MTINDIIDRAGLDDANVICIYPYGSRVYGNFHKKSDYDFIVIVKKKTTEQFSDNQININYYTVAEHQQRLDDHEISALECHFLPIKTLDNISWLFEKPYPNFKFTLDLQKLRHSLSAKSSNSWVKCKKKLTVEKDLDLNIGRKSLFHSFRIIDFGIQIAEHGKIVDYGSCNELYQEIMDYYVWDDLFETFKQRYNALMSEFRKLAEK